ncbi:hypothetical protein CHS0354_015488 [Potamilus streckersoni]|uniref:Alpha/beta hydrolase fold-3 domain-containing protein n=1 Tax=Potamilus streckersoni TaxID=2493646 RepID=A0AAE0SEK0_9BIVA|nr:hypothetical protein CHS0354_015488 [Potamilus streckersoni]
MCITRHRKVSHLSSGTGQQFISYRMSPEHPFPIPLEDCVQSVEYVIQNAALLQVDSKRIAVAGDSAGGNLAAAVSLCLKKKIKLQLLLVPVLQCFNFKTSSFVENAEYFSKTTNNVFQVTFWLNYLGLPPSYQHAFLSNNHTSATLKNSKYASYVDQKKWMKDKYVRNPILMLQSSQSNDFRDKEISKSIEEKILNPLIAPLMADDADLEDLPITYIMTAGYDLIRDDGIMYAHRLMHAGVKTHLSNIPDSFHIAFTFVDSLMELELGRKTVQDIVDFIKNEL